MTEDEASPKYGGMRAGLIFSTLVHSALLASVIFTIHTHQPSKFPEPTPMAVDILTPSDVTKLRQGSRTAKQMESEAKETPETKTSKKEADKPKPVATNTPPPPPPDPPAKEQPKSDPITDKIASAPPPATEPPPPLVPAPEEKKKLDEIVKEEARRVEERKAEEKRKADEVKKAADKKKADDAKKKKEAELKRKKEEERKRKEAAAKSKNFNEEITAALLDKSPDKGAPPPPSETKAPNAKKGPVLGAPEGRDKQLSATERDMLISRITRRVEECYRPPVGAAAGLEGLRVTLIFDLRPDGTLAGPPKAVRTDGTRLTPAAAEAAERAVVGCQPYDLPKDKYDFWKGVELDFNPKGLFGG